MATGLSSQPSLILNMVWQQSIFDLVAQTQPQGAAEWVTGASNQHAYDMVTAWPAWSSRVVVLYGPGGVGKTHLARIWQQQSKAGWYEQPPELAASQAHVVLDGIEKWLPGPQSHPSSQAKQEQAWLHTLNSCQQRQGGMLITARTPPLTWPLLLPDLTSRLRGAQLIQIGEPDEALLAALYTKWFADRQLHVPAFVIEWLVLQLPRQADIAQQLVAGIDAFALQTNRQITVALVEDYLSSLEGQLDI